MVEVKFNFNEIQTIIQCNLNEKIEDVYKKYEIKIRKDISQLYFLYNGNIIKDGNLNLNEIINEEDKRRNIMNIIVNENDDTIIKDNLIKSKEILCPDCNENILINFNEYKINLFNCKNNHRRNNILLDKYDNNIDISKIICNNCKIKNKSNTHNNEFYKCNTCKVNICPLCKASKHKLHKIINYDNKNYICEIHNKENNKYCQDCKINICILCSKEHRDHSTIYYDKYDKIILNEEENKKEINKLKEYINKFNKNINDIIEILKSKR